MPQYETARKNRALLQPLIKNKQKQCFKILSGINQLN